MERGRGRVYLGVLAAACCALLGYAAAALAVSGAKPFLEEQDVVAIRTHLHNAVRLEQLALRDIAKRAPGAARTALHQAQSQLSDSQDIMANRYLGANLTLRDVDMADDLDLMAEVKLHGVHLSDVERWDAAKSEVKSANARKSAAIHESFSLPTESTSSSESTETPSLEACAGQATATQDFVKVSYPGLAGATGGVGFSTSAGSQAKTFALGSSGIGVATGFTAPTSGFATITVSLSTPSGPLSLTFTFPANSTPSSDCTLHK